MTGASASITGIPSKAAYGQFKVTPFDTSVITTNPDSRQFIATTAKTTTSLPRTVPSSYHHFHELIPDDSGKPPTATASKSQYAIDTSSQSAAPTAQSSAMSAPPPPPLSSDLSTASNRVRPPPPRVKSTPEIANTANSLPPPPVRRGGKLGPNKDGRVRNPVPRKLKGKTDDKNGNFAVMHMDMNGTESASPIPRAEAAQRTSENTAKAARTAQKEGYVPMKKRKVLATPPTTVSINTTELQHFHSPELNYGPSSVSILPDFEHSNRRRSQGLSAQDTKHEQARLLTLLRSLTPITVVDQMCKALAFFGGIPGAPPPDHGRFPESAEANGSGSLFIGWLSELFPNLDRTEVRDDEADRGKRPRGRPKGSKATKARKDKGIKKGPKQQSGELEDGDNDNDEDDDSGDIEEGDSHINTSRLSATDHLNPLTSSSQYAAHASYQPPMTTAALRNVLIDEGPAGLSPTMANMGKRRPGKQKDDDGNEDDASALPSYTTHYSNDSVHPGTYQSTQNTTSDHFHMPTQEIPTSSAQVGSLNNRVGPSMPQSSQTLTQDPPVSVPSQPAKRNRAKASAKVAASKPEQKNTPATSAAPTALNVAHDPSTTQIISVPPVTGEKRKRNRAKVGKDNIPSIPVAQLEEKGANNAILPLASGHLQAVVGTGRESPIPPPPKRQRKPKDSPTLTQKSDERNASLVSASPNTTYTPQSGSQGLQKAQSSMLSPLSRQMQPTPVEQFSSKQAAPFNKPLPQFHSSALPKQSALLQQQFPQMDQTPTSGQQQSPNPSQHMINNNTTQSQSIISQQPSRNMQKPMTMSMMYDPIIEVQHNTPSQQSSIQQMTQVHQPSALQQPNSGLEFKPASQSLLSTALPHTMAHIMTPSSMPSNMGSADSLLSTTRPHSTRPSTSRTVDQGLETNYDHFASLQYDTPPQAHSHQHRLSLSNNSLARISPIANSAINPSLNTSTFFQPQPLPQHHQQTRQLSSQSPFNQSNFSTQQPSNAYIAHSQAAMNNNPYRTSHPQHPVHNPAFSPRRSSHQNQHQHHQQQQQQQQQQYYQFDNTTAMDLPALDTLTQNSIHNSNSNLNSSLSSTNLNPYGQNLHQRVNSNSYGSLTASPGLGGLSAPAGGLATLPNMGPAQHQSQSHHDFMGGASGAGFLDFRDKLGRGMGGSLGERR